MQYSKAVQDDRDRLINDILYKLTSEDYKNEVYIGIQYPFHLKRNLLKEGLHTIFTESHFRRPIRQKKYNSEKGCFEINVFHTNEEKTLEALVETGYFKGIKNLSTITPTDFKVDTNIYRSPNMILTTYVQATQGTSDGEKLAYRPIENILIVTFDWELYEERNSITVATYRNLELKKDGAIWQDKKFTGAKIDITKGLRIKEFAFLKALMNEQNKAMSENEESIILETDINQITKMSGWEDTKDHLNQKLLKTAYMISRQGLGYMLRLRPISQKQK